MKIMKSVLVLVVCVSLVAVGDALTLKVVVGVGAWEDLSQMLD